MTDLDHLLNAAPASDRNADAFRIKIQNRAESTYISIDDDIGSDGFGNGIAAKDVSAAIRGAGKIEVYIHSPGGAFFDGAAIFQALKRHKHRVEVEVGALAFSAASLIAMAGDHVKISPSSAFGIHRAWTLAKGNSSALRDALQWVDQIDKILVREYASKSGQDEATIKRWLDGPGGDGTLWNGVQAVELGFADELIGAERKQLAASKTENSSSQVSTAPQIAAKKIDGENWALPPKAKPAGASVAAAQLRLFKRPRRSI